jgi:hypothetical protein
VRLPKVSRLPGLDEPEAAIDCLEKVIEQAAFFGSNFDSYV